MRAREEMMTTPPPSSVAALAFCAAALARALVGFQPHSGQDNHHGSHGAYGGDAEAQRHWMELAYHLPLGEWYYHDPSYWGLDYPPLTAYASWACGALAHALVGPHSVALYESRRREMDGPTRAFLRGTVLVLDLGVYATAVWWWLLGKERERRRPSAAVDAADVLLVENGGYGPLADFAIAMLQPALLLIDHGHFQYNSVALGLALWSFRFMARPNFASCAAGSVLFVMALSFKQMTLYYAPAVFSYLLGRCAAAAPAAAGPANNLPPFASSWVFWRRFAALGLAVVAAFAALWGPFAARGPAGTSPASRLLHVLRRVLPLERGLFESKVSNVWCVLSLRPVRIRDRIPPGLQPAAALALTAALMLPSCLALFRGGRNYPPPSPSPDRVARRAEQQHQRDLLLRGTACCACSFFLASFQVHEKSILMALAPASLLPPLGDWFGIVAAWTLWPLLVLDRLRTAYFCAMVFFAVALAWREPSARPGRTARRLARLSYAAMVALHLLEGAVAPPPGMPDLFPVLWSVLGCALVSCAYLVLCRQLLLSADADRADAAAPVKPKLA